MALGIDPTVDYAAEAGGVLDMISKTEEERYRYEMRTKALRDYVSGIESALQEGREKGLQEGHEKGLEAGQWLGRIQTLQELLGEVVSTPDEVKAWDDERLQRTAELLQARLRERV
jgi:flagellar biosynthesis/type III secretory pathway protein FliH